MIHRLRRAVSLMRPRSLARLAARLDRLDALRTDVARLVSRRERDFEAHRALEKQQRALLPQLEQLVSAVDRLATTAAAIDARLAALELRNSQLTAIATADAETAAASPAVDAALDLDRAVAHVRAAIARTPLVEKPFPHMVVDDLLPRDLYDALVAAIPPHVLFEDRPVNKRQMKMPPRLAPAFSRRVWRFMAADLVDRPLKEAVLAKFHAPLLAYLQRFWPDVALDARTLPLVTSDGRIILRQAGYVIPPHRDPRWGFITCILYLARPGDPSTWGTQLYHVHDDSDAPSAQPYWMADRQSDLVTDVPFVANRALIFLNSEGSHGASIPADAPADFERYIYQWRIGPHPNAARALLAQLEPGARQAWEGKDAY